MTTKWLPRRSAGCLSCADTRSRSHLTARARYAKSRESPPEVIILDIGLPDIDGYEVAHILQQEKHFSSILIALTGYGQAQDKERARKAGFRAHLVKPVGIAEIRGSLPAYTARVKKIVRHLRPF